MLETSARLLKLLALLQTHHGRSGAELADRLGVTARTVRRDVERLRELGYPVHAVRGSSGYRLGAGAALPPLLLDDDEAVAVVVGLRTAADGSVTGIEEPSLRALAKLEQVLPSRLRHRVNTLHTAIVRAGAAPRPQVAPDTLMTIAEACRGRERLRFDYASPRGGRSRRTVEPHRLVSFGSQWYLVAFDIDRDDWRTFRVDRLRPRAPTGPRFAPRRPPDDDIAAYLAHRLSVRAWPCRATVVLHAPAEAMAEQIWPGMGVIEPIDDRSCLLHVGADTPWALSWMVTAIDVDFTVADASPGLTRALRSLAARCERAIRGTSATDTG
ncbi:helix-turn-helix transcriptional regulator [Glycomyces tarimensis]